MHCVLVVENGTVLDEGVASILRQEPGLEVTNLVYTDESAFLDAVSRARPSIILLNETGPLDPSRVFELLDNDPAAAVPRVIMVHAGSNLLDAYERRTVVATRRSDLVTLIQSGLLPRF